MVLWWPCKTLRVQHASRAMLVVLCGRQHYLRALSTQGIGIEVGVAMANTARPCPTIALDFALATGLARHLMHSYLAYQTTLR